MFSEIIIAAVMNACLAACPMRGTAKDWHLDWDLTEEHIAELLSHHRQTAAAQPRLPQQEADRTKQIELSREASAGAGHRSRGTGAGQHMSSP